MGNCRPNQTASTETGVSKGGLKRGEGGEPGVDIMALGFAYLRCLSFFYLIYQSKFIVLIF